VTNLFRGAVLALALTLPCAVAAQEQQSSGTPAEPDQEPGISVYPAAYFADLGPVSALDMIRQLPGFSFVDADNSRGYAGAGGNVLINGRRPSTKTTRLQTILLRLQASAVDRVEVIRGGTPGYDTQGLPVVANIVRTIGVSNTGSVTGLGKFYPNGDIGLIARAERSRQSETSLIEGNIELRRELDDEESGEGPIKKVDAGGSLIEQGLYVVDTWTTRFRGAGAYERPTEKGLFRANLALNHNSNDENESTVVQDVLGIESQDTVRTDFNVSRLEFGADYDAEIRAGTSYQIVAVQTLSWKEDDSTRVAGDDLQIATEQAREGESILRGLVRKNISPTLNIEFGAEGAFNFLDSETSLTDNGFPIILPGANVLIEELRGEIYSTLTKQPSSRTSVELGVRGEMSQITVSGGSDAKNDYSFLKPRMVGSYSADQGAQFRLRVELEVGQLDFDDFAAGSELANGTVNAGNPNLAPEQAWVYEVAYEQPIFGGSTFAATLRLFDIEDVVDLVPIEDFAAPGNIGDGTREELEIILSLPLESIGPGLGRLQLSGTWRESDVTDPVTGENRGISGEPGFQGDVLYTLDFPALNSTFGMRGELTSKETSYRLEQITATRNENYWRVYWDWRAASNLFYRFQIENPTSRDRWRNRIRYDGLRSDGIIESREKRSAILDPMLVIRVQWTF